MGGNPLLQEGCASDVNLAKCASAISQRQSSTLKTKVAFLTSTLQEMEEIKYIKHLLKREFSKSDYSLESIKDPQSVLSVLEKLGAMATMRRCVTDLYTSEEDRAYQTALSILKKEEMLLTPQKSDDSSLDFIKRTRETWGNITQEEMICYAKENGLPLMTEKETKDSDQEEQQENKKQITNQCTSSNSKHTRFLYDSNDLLYTLQGIKPFNRTSSRQGDMLGVWGSIQVQLKTSSIYELRRIFHELRPEHAQIGLDDISSSSMQEDLEQIRVFLQEKFRIGDLVVDQKSTPMARQYAKTGCPDSLRPVIWSQALGLVRTSEECAERSNYFDLLSDEVKRVAYLTDEMYQFDIQQTINDSDYFVFEDHFKSVVMAFSRDSYVNEHAFSINGKVTMDDDDNHAVIPPNGVLPFNGLVLYVAPLMYLYEDPVDIYFVFRQMYIKYWSALNAISSDGSKNSNNNNNSSCCSKTKHTILYLCKLFEDLIVCTSSPIVWSLLHRNIQPLDLAFHWIQSGFVGILPIKQVLLLWDRIIGFDSIEILAVTAAAIFHLRSKELMNEAIQHCDDAQHLFVELCEIQVVPLLEEYLFLLDEEEET